MKNFVNSIFNVCLFGILLLSGSLALADVDDFSCGSLQNGYGPYDYRSDRDKLGVVEAHHFTSEVAGLVRGKSGYIGGDLDYTLRAFPNHSRALMAMVQLGDREKATKASGAQYSVECYLNRAIRFRSDDATVKMIYANYLVKRGRSKDALKQLNDAVSLNDSNTSLNYNIALVYLELKEYDQALAYAHKAYQAGFPLPGLRDRLKRAGKWREFVPESEVSQNADDESSSVNKDKTSSDVPPAKAER